MREPSTSPHASDAPIVWRDEEGVAHEPLAEGVERDPAALPEEAGGRDGKPRCWIGLVVETVREDVKVLRHDALSSSEARAVVRPRGIQGKHAF